MLSKDKKKDLYEFISAFNDKINLMLIYESLRMHRAHIENQIAQATIKGNAEKRLSELRQKHKYIAGQMEIICRLMERR